MKKQCVSFREVRPVQIGGLKADVNRGFSAGETAHKDYMSEMVHLHRWLQKRRSVGIDVVHDPPSRCLALNNVA